VPVGLTFHLKGAWCQAVSAQSHQSAVTLEALRSPGFEGLVRHKVCRSMVVALWLRCSSQSLVDCTFCAVHLALLPMFSLTLLSTVLSSLLRLSQPGPWPV
jgi:hypothetical protein